MTPFPVRRRFILCASAFALIAPAAFADILDQFTFGTTSPSILTPTTVGNGITAGAITADAGVTLDVSNSQTPAPASSPWLRVVPTTASPTPQLAITANADFKFTLSALPGFTMNLTSLTFDIMRGGAGTRGYALQTSADNFGSIVSTADSPTQRPTFTPMTVDLSGASFQNLSTLTLKLFSYSGASAQSVEYDNITVNGTSTFAGYTWKGTVDGNWNTTTGNFAGTGTTYVDNTATSNVLFDDSSSTGSVAVGAGGLRPNLITFTNTTAKDYTFTGGALTVATTLFKSGSGLTSFRNSVTAASVTADLGTLEVGAGGTLTSPSITVSQTGLLSVATGGQLGASSGLIANGPVNFNNTTQTIATLAGASPGVVTLNGTALQVTGASTFAGRLSGSGSLIKSGTGTLVLSAANDYFGGTTVSGGALQLTNAAAAGSGGINVNTGGSLVLGAAITNPITLAGGTLGVSAAITSPSDLIVTAPSTLNTFNPATGAGSADLILTGMLQGSGNLNLVSLNGNAPDSQAFRLRGLISTGPNAYSGTITLAQSAKMEIQTALDTGSPIGTGKLVLTGGTTSSGNAGTYSLVNLRNNYLTNTTLGNNVEITGFGAAYFNLVGTAPAGSVTNMGDLLIGDGQAVGAVATASVEFTLAFATVHLNGGIATFTPRPVGNTSFVSSENISLGTITEKVAGSGITMNGASTLLLTGANTYTGPTQVFSGTLVVNGSIAASTLTVNGGTVGGTGTLGTTTLLTGTLNPGNGSGVLNSGALNLSGGTLAIDINGNTAGTYDQLNVTGTVSLNAPIQLALNFGSFDPADGVDRFTILNNDLSDAIVFGSPDSRFVYNGTTLTEGTVFTATSGAFSQDFRISYVGGTNGNDVVLTAVPEPSALALLGSAALLGCARRRRNGR